ncbi:acyl-CoA synthetase, putative [Plasmodium gaboni]|uniref:Acyl-CoA synthetase, putative n=1 Tax=Plasmodium gaboni TaxID=647221 RepID=A0ABY0KW58_9APIC|nr:acyl-CoA synthetase, putative [Plasmodium gaboni]
MVACFSYFSIGNKGYSEIFEESENKDESRVYCVKDHKKKNLKYTYTHIMKIFYEKFTLSNYKIALVEHASGVPHYYMTYGMFLRKVLSFSNCLNKYEGSNIPENTYNEEMNNGKFKLLGLYGSNSINWLITDLGAMLSGVTTLVMHSKFSIDVIVDILNETKLEWLCLDLDLVEGLMKRRNKLPHLKTFIILDTLVKPKEINTQGGKENNIKTNKSSVKRSKKKNNNNIEDNSEDITIDEFECDNEKLEILQGLKEKGSLVGINIISFDDMTKHETADFNIKNDSPDFITSIVYTSGTSGKPKGVMLSNKNFYYGVVTTADHDVLVKFSLQKHLSYLPISHIYARMFVYLIFMSTGRVNIWSKDLNFFSKDIFNSKDAVLGGVPKVFCRIYTNIMTQLDNLPLCKKCIVKGVLCFRRTFKNGCFSKGLEKVMKVSSKIRQKVNPNLEVILNGGGKLSAKIADELCILLDIKYYQGYGLTEFTGPIFAQRVIDNNSEGMGGPTCPSIRYKVRTWETYKASDSLPKGELLIKSNAMFNGYFLEKEFTKNCFTHDGYFITGDVVQINKDGSLTFLDRSKGLVKLSQGEYIETDLLNNLYSQISFINNCVVYGDDSMDGPLGIISVDKSLLFTSLKNDNMLEQCGVTEKNYVDKLIDENINNNIFVDYVKAKMMETYKKTNLNRYNVINNIYLTSKTWDTNNYLTPTLKVKRFDVFKNYAFFINEIKQIYENKLKGNIGNDKKKKK